MQEKIPLNGISYATPNATSTDGDSLILVNLRQKNNSLQPVSPGKEIGTLTRQYDLIYLHPTSYSQNYIGTIDNTIYTDILTTPVKICSLNTQILQIRSVSNTLILLTAIGLYYLLYHNGTYTPLGYKPPLPEISLRYNTTRANLKFDTIEGTLPDDLQAPMEALYAKCRWQDDNAHLLAGIYIMRYALRLYDGSHIRHSPPLCLNHSLGLQHPYRTTFVYSGSSFQPGSSGVGISLYTITADIDTDSLLAWKDIIVAIDIFISCEMGMVSQNLKKIDDCKKTISQDSTAQHLRHVSFTPQDIDNDLIISNISDNGNFYLIKSIPLHQTTASVTFPAKTEISTLQNLVHQPLLSVDNFSHHTISAAYAYVYNQRLHLADIQTTFYQGFPFLLFCRRKSNNSSSGADRPSGLETVRPAIPAIQEQHIDNIYIEISINTPEKNNGFVLTHTSNIDLYYPDPLFSYPDSRAYKAVIYYCDKQNNITHKKELPLQPHNSLNIAYYLDPSLVKITLDEATGKYTVPATTPLYTADDQKIKVSALQNPFLFPNENTYITSGKVIGMASNAQTLSEGQFGQFPLYIFTSEGIFAMSIGTGELVYSNIIPVSEEHALPHTITPIAGAIFFLTLRGAFLLIGSQTTSISTQLNTHKPVQTFQFYQQIRQHLFPGLHIDNLSFLGFCQQKDLSVQYNYIQNEILIISQNLGYAYVYNFTSQTWHTTTNTFSPVQNTYPRLLGVVVDKLIDVSDETDTPVPVLLLTRPLKLHSQQYKTLHRLILRSRLKTLHDTGLFAFASNDGENFILKSNLRLREGTHRDPDTGLIPRATYRYYALLFAANLYPDSRLDYFETTYYPAYNNDKLR